MMLAESLAKLGVEVIVYDPDPDAPAMLRVRRSYCAPWDDTEALAHFVDACDVITYEFENIRGDVLATFSGRKPIIPSPAILITTRDRALEKQFLREHDLPRVAHAAVSSDDELREAGRSVGFPLILKSAEGGYDGKGQVKVKAANQLKAAWAELGHRRAMAEEMIDLSCEASCIVARTGSGQEVAFPVVDNLHTDHILDLSVLPSKLPRKVQRALQSIALQAARSFHLEGLLTTEFFLSKKPGRGEAMLEVGGYFIAINEFAPRPHNSGHVTRNACTMSQFDALARILAGVPMTTPELVSRGEWCMGNLLGDVWISQGNDELDLEPWSWSPGIVDVILYGKKAAREKRKMGHFVAFSRSGDASKLAKKFRAALEEHRPIKPVEVTTPETKKGTKSDTARKKTAARSKTSG